LLLFGLPRFREKSIEVGSDLGVTTADLDGSFKDGPIFDDQSVGSQVAHDGPALLEFDSVGRVDIANHLTGDYHFAGHDVGVDVGSASYIKPVATERNGPFYFAFEFQIVMADEFSLNFQAGSQGSGCPNRRAWRS